MTNVASKWLFVFICLVGFLFRFWQVATVPPSLSWDEVSIGYNAYSILKTGSDEHGRTFPLDAFTAYGDYKPPLAIYLTVPFVAVFGLTEFAVRLPVVISSLITIIGMFVLVHEIFGKKNLTLALLATSLVAISPWHILLSRAGFEATIALSLIVWGSWAVLNAMHKPWWRIWCWLPFVAAIYTFNSSRYFVPFLSVGLIFFGGLKLWITHWQKSAIGFFIGLIFLVPIIPHIISPQARLRFIEVNIFSDSSIVERANERIMFAGNTTFSKIINNRRIGFFRAYLLHFFDHTQPQFLFVSGDGNPKFSVQDIGQLYLIEAPLLCIGFVWLMAKEPRIWVFLIFWIVAAIIPAATARETPHALRILNTLPVWYIWIGYGIWTVWSSLRTHKRLLVTVFIAAYAVSVGYFLHLYFGHYPKEFSGEWQFGYREAIQYSQQVKNKYQHIYMTDSIGRPYMYTAFYGRYAPQILRASKKRYFDAAGFYHVDGFDIYEFIRQPPTKFTTDSLYILDLDKVPQNAHILKTIRRLDGKPALVIFDLL